MKRHGAYLSGSRMLLTGADYCSLHLVESIAEFDLANPTEIFAVCQQIVIFSVRNEFAAVHDEDLVICVYQFAGEVV